MAHGLWNWVRWMSLMRLSYWIALQALAGHGQNRRRPGQWSSYAVACRWLSAYPGPDWRRGHAGQLSAWPRNWPMSGTGWLPFT
jgi:hypothetical protein